MKKRRVMLTVAAIMFVLAVVCGMVPAGKIVNDAVCENHYRELRRSVIPASDDDPVPLQVNAEELVESNPDIIAWISIPCIDCSYPVLQGTDNSYYLSHDAQKEPAFAGSIILDCDCSPDFSALNSVLYGHNMLNGTMFGRLWHIPYKGAAAEEPYFWIFREGEVLKYRIFSAFGTDRISEAFKLFDKGNDDFDSWCMKMREQSYIDTGRFNYEYGMRIVTLTTCGSDPWYRTVVAGVLEEIMQDDCN